MLDYDARTHEITLLLLTITVADTVADFADVADVAGTSSAC